MHDVSGYTKKDGTRVRSYRRRNPGRRGGGGGGFAITVVIGGLVLTLGGGYGTIRLLEPNSSTRSRSTNSTNVSEAKGGFNRAESALAASGYKTQLATDFDPDCVKHSYGRVHEYFRSHPCRWLARAYLQLGYSEILVSISWVGFSSASEAEWYKRLIDTPGAGGIVELSRDTTLYRKIGYAGSPHLSGMNGSAVWNVQVKPVFPRPADEINRVLAESRQ